MPPDSPGQVARPWSGVSPMSVAVWLLIGALTGSLLAAGYAATRPVTASAQALYALASDRTILPGSSSDGDGSSAFVQGELLVLNGPQVSDDVREQLAPREPGSFSGAQVGNTAVISITATAADADTALATVQAASDVYAESRRARLRTELRRAAGIIDDELRRLEEAFASGGPGSSALQSEYGRLLAVRSELFRADANVATAVREVQPPSATVGGGGTLRRVFSGAVLGALLGVGALLVLRRVSTRIRTADDLAGTGAPVLRPVLPRHSRGLGALAPHHRVRGPARLLAGQLVPTEGDPGVVVVVGATGGVGTSWVAAALSAALVERGDVLLVLLADLLQDGRSAAARQLGVGQDPGLADLHGSPLLPGDVRALVQPSWLPGLDVLAGGLHPPPGHLRHLLDAGLLEACSGAARCVVVDAPAPTDSGLFLDVVKRADAVVLVSGLGVTRPADVADVQRLLDRQHLRLDGVVVDAPRRPLLRRRRRRRAPDVDVEHHDDTWADDEHHDDTGADGEHHDEPVSGDPEAVPEEAGPGPTREDRDPAQATTRASRPTAWPMTGGAPAVHPLPVTSPSATTDPAGTSAHPAVAEVRPAPPGGPASSSEAPEAVAAPTASSTEPVPPADVEPALSPLVEPETGTEPVPALLPPPTEPGLPTEPEPGPAPAGATAYHPPEALVGDTDGDTDGASRPTAPAAGSPHDPLEPWWAPASEPASHRPSVSPDSRPVSRNIGIGWGPTRPPGAGTGLLGWPGAAPTGGPAGPGDA